MSSFVSDGLPSKMLVVLCLNEISCFIMPLYKKYTMYSISKRSQCVVLTQSKINQTSDLQLMHCLDTLHIYIVYISVEKFRTLVLFSLLFHLKHIAVLPWYIFHSMLLFNYQHVQRNAKSVVLGSSRGQANIHGTYVRFQNAKSNKKLAEP